MKEKIQNFKNQNGSITLFVLIACMFFIIVLIGLFISNQNKIQSQAKQIAQIQDTYKVSLNEMDEQYSNVSNSGSSNITMEQILDLVYPVGSIYISENSTSPETLFGGTWVQIKDTFLLSAGDIYSAGSSGGEASHTLTIAEMPAHTHNFAQGGSAFVIGSNTNHDHLTLNSGFYSMENGGWFYDHRKNLSSITSTGNSQAHNNMPPYFTVYMWKRTA